jgi:hypothetical protein
MTTIMIKKSAGYELRKLFYDILTNDPVLTTRIYHDERGNEITANVWDTVPKNVKPPYATIGKAAIKIDHEFQTKDNFIDMYMVEIDCFTHYGGKSDVSELMNDAMFALSTAWANNLLQFDDDSSFEVGTFEIDVRGEDVSVWGPKDREHNVMTCNVRVVQVA